jgi:hypothetical protein
MSWLRRGRVTRTIWLMAYLTDNTSLLIAPSLYAFPMCKLQTATAGTGGLHVLLLVFLLTDAAFSQFKRGTAIVTSR